MTEETTRAEDELLKRFVQLVKEWRDAVGAKSNSDERVADPAFRKIVAMGKPIIPILILQMSLDPGEWGHALHEITGEDPIPEGHHGDRVKMAEDWKQWGIANGYVSEDDFDC